MTGKMIHPKTNAVIQLVDGIDIEALKEQFKLNFSEKEFESIIANLRIPAEARALLTELLNFQPFPLNLL